MSRLTTLAAALIVVLCLGLTVNACARAPTYAAQGYETDAGYMQPDHGAFYYWLAYHSTFGYYRPSVSYHVYVPPAGYAPSYRPWYSRPVQPTYRYAPNALTPNRATGGFSGTTQPRTSGGFSNPYRSTAPTPPNARTGGGFSTPPSQPSSRTSGGFSTQPPKPPPPKPSSSRSSGGFSRRGR